MATATDGELDTIANGGGKSLKTKTQLAEQLTAKTRIQLLDLFEKKGYTVSIIKAATKPNKLTAQVLTELHGA